jgi:hypothetical protein
MAHYLAGFSAMHRGRRLFFGRRINEIVKSLTGVVYPVFAIPARKTRICTPLGAVFRLTGSLSVTKR